MSAVDADSTANGFAQADTAPIAEPDAEATAALLRGGAAPNPKQPDAPTAPLAEPAAVAGAAVSGFSEDRIGAAIGPYRIEAVIASGGMGTVYQAWQSEPVKRRVALKMIRRGMADEATIQRFQIERQALAVMDHPDIARVYEAGTTPDGNPFFAMEYCEGAPIDEYCNERKLSITDRVQLVVRIARAVQRAHNHGVIHRDLKPANVLVSDCEGRPNLKVIDFGIAKLADDSLMSSTAQATQIGEMVGTPAYMSPEQASGASIDGRTDVFAIGALLFKLLTGQTPLGPPPDGAGLADIIRHITAFEPVTPTRRFHESDAPSQQSVAEHLGLQRPSQWAASVRGDLDWITLRATESDKLRRYATVDDLADDLERYLNHEPVVAAAPSAAYRLRKFYQRRRAMVSATAAIVATVLASSGVSGFQWYRQHQQVQAEYRQVQNDATQLLDQAAQARSRASQGGPSSASEFVAAQTAVAKVESLLADRPALRFATLQDRLERTQGEIAADKRALQFVQQLSTARERATQVDKETSGDAFGRLASLTRLAEAYRDFEIVPGETPAEIAANKILACPQSTHKGLIESLDFWLNEEPLGAGLFLHHQGGRITIAEVIEGGAAYDNSQLRVGDRLLKVDDTDLLESFTSSQLRSETYRLLSRPAGSRIQVTFVRGLDEPRTCEVTCGGANAEWAHDVLAIVDPDLWRMRLRRAVLSSSLADLRALSESDRLLEQPAFSLIQLAGSRFQLERSNAAIRMLEIAQHRHPANFWANHYLGTALASAHDPPQPEESLRYLVAAVSLRPTSVGARMNLAEAFARIGDHKSAHSHMQAAADLSPGYRPLEERLRSLAAPAGNATQTAEPTADPRTAPPSPVTPKTLDEFEGLARSLARKGERKAAMQVLHDAAERFAGDSRLRRCKGIVLLELQDFTAARIVLSDAARLIPNDAASRFYYGVALQYSGDSRSAIHEYEAALQLRPDYAAVREYLDPLRAANGQ